MKALRILLVGDLAAYPDPLKPVRNGYIYMVDGRVETVGRQPVPEEHQYVDLVIGGKGRILLPARTAALMHATLYPLRHMIMGREPYGMALVKRFIGELDCESAWAAAILGLYEASLSGIGHVVLEDIHASCVKRAVEDVGIDAVVAVPAGCIEGYDWRRDLAGGGIGVSICSSEISVPGETMIYGHGLERNDVSAVFYASPRRALGVATPGWMPRGRGFALGIGAWSRYDVQAAALSLAARGIQPRTLVKAMHAESLVPGSRDGVIVLSINKPPGWIHGEAWQASSYLALGPVETMILGDNIVVDGGENMLVEEGKLREASEIIKGVLNKIYG